jgi:ParB-like chromosome segregation protein Spo0J
MAKRSAVAVRIPDTLQHLSVDITTLKPWPQNPRKGDLDAIRESLRVNGQFRPIVVRRADNTILAGNHTYFAAQAESWPEIAVTFVEPRDEAHAKRIVLADNRTAGLGTFDDALLTDLLASLEGEIAGTGYDQAALDDLLASLGSGGFGTPIEDVEPQIDRAEELREKYGVVPIGCCVGIARTPPAWPHCSGACIRRPWSLTRPMMPIRRS